MLAPLPRFSSEITVAALLCVLGFVDGIFGLQLGAGDSSASTDPSRKSHISVGGASHLLVATPTAMLEQTVKSSGLLEIM